MFSENNAIKLEVNNKNILKFHIFGSLKKYVTHLSKEK